MSYFKQITLKEFRKYFDMSHLNETPRQAYCYLEEVKWILKDVGCANKNNSTIIVEVVEHELEDNTMLYWFHFYFEDKLVWEIRTHDGICNGVEIIKLNLVKEGTRLYDEYLNVNQLTMF